VVDGGPVAAGVIGCGILLLAGLGDLRRLRAVAPTLRGGRRLYRHLWRMCWAFFIASGSFFIGQADEIPIAIRYWPALIVLAFTPLLAVAYWAWRLRPARRKRGWRAMTLRFGAQCVRLIVAISGPGPRHVWQPLEGITGKLQALPAPSQPNCDTSCRQLLHINLQARQLQRFHWAADADCTLIQVSGVAARLK
jgi:hypothetical protein